MNHRMVTFLYTLMRDHVSTGVVEALMVEHAEKDSGPFDINSYSNKDLAKYAVKITKRLMKRNVAPSVKKKEAAARARAIKAKKKEEKD